MFRDLFGASKANAKTPASQSASAPAPASIPAHQCSETVLGSDTHFEGQLNCKGNIRIEGTFIGNITTEGCISLGAEAMIEGSVIGEAVTVAGLVRGDVIARRISVLRTGRVFGDLALEQLATEEGAFIQGVITMEERIDIAAEVEYLRAEKVDTPLESPEPVEASKPRVLESVPAKTQNRNNRSSR